MSRAAPRHVFLSCGEASGDRYGARVVAALRRRDPDLRFTALGGPLLEAAGVEIIQPSAAVAVMGVGEVARALPALLEARRRLDRHLANGAVDLFLPIDFPGFNGHLAAGAHRRGVPVFWLVAPQLWAWGGWRAASFRRRVDRLGTILPFETAFFRNLGFDVEPLGHPLMDDYGNRFAFEPGLTRREERLNHRDGPLTIGLLPGSRRQELEALLPVLKVTSQAITAHMAGREVRFILSLAPGVDRSRVETLFTSAAEMTTEPLRDLMPRLDLALVCSGTASLEVALAGVPHEIVYRTGRVTAFLGRRLVKSPHIGLANLILDKRVVREHLQDEASPLPLARELLRWLARPADRQAYYGEVRRLRQLCGAPGAWERAADAAMVMLDRGARAAGRP
ncbi:MAG: lipid-A-disaccharide synthase [bacterium]|nr:lipid-A-disaccharide synthase [bacterium]